VVDNGDDAQASKNPSSSDDRCCYASSPLDSF
jgi:hypothetical protein